MAGHARKAHREIRKRGRRGSKRGPSVDAAERVGMQRPPSPFVVVRQELGAIGRDVDVRRALGLAGLARQAEIERLFDRFVLPAASALRPAAARTACGRGRACCALPRAWPCSSGTSCRRPACGIRRCRCSEATLWPTIPHRQETRSVSPAGPACSRRRDADFPLADRRRRACAGSCGWPDPRSP